MKITEIEEQLKDKSHKEIQKTLDTMFDELNKLYNKYAFTKTRYIYLRKSDGYGGEVNEMSFQSLKDLKTTMIKLVKEDITERMVEIRTQELLTKLELL